MFCLQFRRLVNIGGDEPRLRLQVQPTRLQSLQQHQHALNTQAFHGLGPTRTEPRRRSRE